MSAAPGTGIRLAAAGPHDLPALHQLIFDHGANIWNYLPEVGIREHLQDIAQGRAHGVLALDQEQLIGAVTFGLSTDFDRYLPEQARGTPQGYVSEAVVRRDRTGQGWGTRLLRQALVELGKLGAEVVLIDRHEENLASAGMMRAAGFVEMDTYADPRRRPNGSGRTTVCCFSFADRNGSPGP